ncbi:MAG: hypothetical protein KC468_08240 [Myxococcales bacterium]|nr:hypothetical protein [Myxococcales bacterium]
MLHLVQQALLVAAVAPTPAPSAAASPERAAPQAQRIRALVIRSPERAALDLDALRSALELRAPGRTIALVGRAAPTEVSGGPWALLDLRPDGDAVVLSVILEDGRAFDRRVVVEPEEAPRAVAATVANLLAAIEEQRVVADREDVARPELPELREPSEPSEPSGPKEPREPPEAREPISSDSEMPNAPSRTPEPASPPETPARAPSPSLGLSLAPGVALGLGAPTDPGALAAGGGELGIDLKLPVGALVGLGLRGAARAREGYRVDRLRVALVGGYRYRARAFELDARLLASVEPWRVANVGAGTASADGEALVGYALGFGARMEPGVWFSARPGVDLRVGPWVELTVSGAADEDFTVVHVRDADGSSLFRVGGVELSLGVSVGAWFDLPRRDRARARGR